MYKRTHASVFSREHLFEVASLIVGKIIGVRVESGKHCVGGFLDKFRRVNGIHVIKIELFEKIIEYVKILSHLEIMILLCRRRQKRCQRH